MKGIEQRPNWLTILLMAITGLVLFVVIPVAIGVIFF